MKKETVLHVLIGLLLGFIAGYLMHEVMVVRQPIRLVHGDDTTAADAPPVPNNPSPLQPPQNPAGDPMAEIQQLRDQVAKNPDDADAVVRLAGMNFMIRNWPRAAELFEHYLELAPDSDQAPDVMSDLGACYRELKQPEKALEMFAKVTTKSPTHWQAMFNEVIVLAFDLRRFDQADKVLAELKRLQPANPDVDRLVAEVGRMRSNPS